MGKRNVHESETAGHQPENRNDAGESASRALTVYSSPNIIAPAGYVHAGEALMDDAPRVVAWGVDTLYMSFDVHLGEQTWERLQQEQDRAKEIASAHHAVYCPEWLNAIIRPHGAQGGYHFLIESDAWSIKLLRDTPNRPPIYVELRAHALKTHPGGVRGLCEEVCTYVRDVLLTDAEDGIDVLSAITVDAARLSRLDLHCDWQGGWQPTLRDGELRTFLKPGRAFWHPYLEGNVCTGYRIGKGHVQARIYNKTRQARQKQVDWYFTFLEQQNGTAYNPIQDVWRLEFELTRAGVMGFRLAARPEIEDPDEAIEAELAAEDLPSIGTVGKALHWLGHMFHYLTRYWLRVVVPREDTNRARWPINPTWSLLHDVFVEQTLRGLPSLPEERLRLVRQDRHSGYRRLIDRMALGVMQTLDLMESEPAEALVAWMRYHHRIAQLALQQRMARALYRGVYTVGERRVDAYGEREHTGIFERERRLLVLLESALGIYTSAGVVSAQLPQVETVADLFNHFAHDLEAIASIKGGIGQLLLEKRCKVYKALDPRGMFTQPRDEKKHRAA